MSVVVSDTSPLHYLILCGVEGVLPQLFQQVVIPTTVFAELQHSNTPAPVREWAQSLPPWVRVQKPNTLDQSLNVDAGEMEAISLAKEIHAAAALIDDRRADMRRCSVGCRSLERWVSSTKRPSSTTCVDRPTSGYRSAPANKRSTRPSVN